MNQELRLEGKNPFYDYQLPMAIIRLKQAIGRTMRRVGQRSAVLILDSRMASKRYGKQISKSLARSNRVRVISREQVFSKVQEFLNKQ